MTSPSSYPRRGELYWVPDAELELPTSEKRTIHERRPVVILSGSATNLDSSWSNVLVVPCSTATDWNTEFCVFIRAREGNNSKDTLARVALVQPLLKASLQDGLGKPLPSERISELESSLLRYLGLL